MATKHIARLPETKGLKSLEELLGMYDSYYLSGKGIRDCLSHTLRKITHKIWLFSWKKKDKRHNLKFRQAKCKKSLPEEHIEKKN